MVEYTEHASVVTRVFLWNEELTRNQICDSEGLCVVVFRRKFRSCVEPLSPTFEWDLEQDEPPAPAPAFDWDLKKSEWDSCSSTVIPFELSKLLNKDYSLGPILLSSILQLLPSTVQQLGFTISSILFNKFEYPLLKPNLPTPTYVIALKICQICVFDTTRDLSVYSPPPLPSFCRFEKDWDEEEELFSTIRSVSPTDFMNDPHHKYTSDILEYMHALRDYTGEAAICPTKPPFVPDLARGLVELKGCSVTPTHQFNGSSIHLMDGTCPVCFEDLQDKNKVITTYCLHDFHISCLTEWLLNNNTCPICRAVYPLHYSPSLSNKRRKHIHNPISSPTKV